MIPVAEAEGITIHAPQDGIVGFHTSPYPVHVQDGAVDIFPGRNFTAPALSPVSGKVVFIEKNKVGVARHFQADPYDYIIAVEQNGICVRMLHVEPEIEEGDEIDIGNRLGRYLRSPLLPFWSYPHIHAEVKDCGDTKSPLDAFPLNLVGSGAFKGSPKEEFVELDAEVVLATNDYLIVAPSMNIFGSIGKYHGLAVNVGREFALLDAQVPWNCYGGLLLSEDSTVSAGKEVKLGGISLGKVMKSRENIATYALGGELGDGIDRYSKGLQYKDVGRFNVPYKRIKVNGEVFLGISTSLSLAENRTLKLVPTEPIKNAYEVGELVSIELDVGGKS